MITPEDAQVILEAIDSALIDVHTSLPAVVVKYNTTTKAVDLELQTKRVLETEDGDLKTEELPNLLNVPTVYNGSSQFVTAYALEEGDQGYVVFSETSLDQWRSKANVTSPADVERHGLSGALFVPCPLTISKIITDALTTGAMFGKIGGVQLRATGTTLEATTNGATTADDFVAMATKVNDQLEKLIDLLTGNTTPPWVPAPNDGGTALQTVATAIFPLGATDVSSTNLKAD